MVRARAHDFFDISSIALPRASGGVLCRRTKVLEADRNPLSAGSDFSFVPSRRDGPRPKSSQSRGPAAGVERSDEVLTEILMPSTPSSIWSRHGAAVLALAFTPLVLGCDPVDDADEFDTPSLQEQDELDELDDDLERVVTPPQTGEEAGKTHVSELGLTADDAPVASLGWMPAVSEETPPATCDGNGAVIGSDCMGWHCDNVQMFCGSHVGSVGTREWSTWFSDEPTSWRICPGTQYVTGVACRGAWCDDISIECTDLGLAYSSCSWSPSFRSEDPVFFAPTGHLVAGVQCLGAYCEKLRYFTCEV